MNKKTLKEIFDLMYEKLTQLAIGNGFFKWVEEKRKITFEAVKDRGDDYLFEELILVIFSGGFRARIVDARWPSIKRAFDNFNIQKVADYDEEKITRLLNNSNIIRHPDKIRATVKTPRKLLNSKDNMALSPITSFLSRAQ